MTSPAPPLTPRDVATAAGIYPPLILAAEEHGRDRLGWNGFCTKKQEAIRAEGGEAAATILRAVYDAAETGNHLLPEGGLPSPLEVARGAATVAGVPLSLSALAEVAAPGRTWEGFLADFANAIHTANLGTTAMCRLERVHGAARSAPRLPIAGPFQGAPPPGFQIPEDLFMSLVRVAIRARAVGTRYRLLATTADARGRAGWRGAALHKVEVEETVAALRRLSEAIVQLPVDVRASAPAVAAAQARDLAGVTARVRAEEWDAWADRIDP